MAILEDEAEYVEAPLNPYSCQAPHSNMGTHDISLPDTVPSLERSVFQTHYFQNPLYSKAEFKSRNMTGPQADYHAPSVNL